MKVGDRVRVRNLSRGSVLRGLVGVILDIHDDYASVLIKDVPEEEGPDLPWDFYLRELELVTGQQQELFT